MKTPKEMGMESTVLECEMGERRIRLEHVRNFCHEQLLREVLRKRRQIYTD